MASNRMLPDVVTLFNYVGEINDKAVYQETTLKHCYCPLNEGADLNRQGKKGKNSARLYIFDRRTIALDELGTKRSYMPYERWKDLDNKSAYWTLSDKGNDYFKKSSSNNRLRIEGFSHKVAGSPRMWHFEVDGK